MSLPSRPIGKILIITFCLWHMCAVALYAIPTDINDHIAKNPALGFIQTLHWRVASPYMLLLSQWQQWNIFSPDPVRLVLGMEIEEQTGTTWKLIHGATATERSWWRFARDIKILYALSDEASAPLRRALLASECASGHLPGGAHIRLTIFRYVLPKESTIPSVDFWKSYKPDTEQKVDSEFTCPAST